MKGGQTKTKFDSAFRAASQLIARVVCLGAIILICSSAPAQEPLCVLGMQAVSMNSLQTECELQSSPRGCLGHWPLTRQAIYLSPQTTSINSLRGERGPRLRPPQVDGNGQQPATTRAICLCPPAKLTSTTFLSTVRARGPRNLLRRESEPPLPPGLDFPTALAFDGAGNLFVANLHTVERDRSADGAIYKFTPAGVRTTFSSELNNPEALAFDKAGNLFVSNASAIDKFTPGGVRSIFASGFIFAGSLACDSAGNLFVADSPAYAIYKITPTGARSTFAATEGVNLLAFQPTLASTPGQLQNISTRAFGQTGDNVIIAGFIITGSGQKKVILRAIGPSLGPSWHS